MKNPPTKISTSFFTPEVETHSRHFTHLFEPNPSFFKKPKGFFERKQTCVKMDGNIKMRGLQKEYKKTPTCGVWTT